MNISVIEESKATEVLTCYWNLQLPVNPTLIATKMGVRVVFQPSAENGRFEIEPDGPAIYICVSDPPARQRFAISHLIGHWQLGHGNSFKDLEENFSTHAASYLERQANSFATSLLMPRSQVISLARSGMHNIDGLARMFGVSRIAMDYRLKNLGLIS